MTSPAILVLIASLVLIGLSFLGLKGKLPQNRWAGLRTSRTLSNKEIWDKANKYAAKWWLATGVLWLSGSIILLISKNAVTESTMVLIAVIPLIVFLVGTILSFMHVKKL